MLYEIMLLGQNCSKIAPKGLEGGLKTVRFLIKERFRWIYYDLI
jgi:hypothetical protein